MIKQVNFTLSLVLLPILLFSQTIFSNQIIIDQDSTAKTANSVYAADLDGDGDMDVLSAFEVDGENSIAWYENTDGLGTFSNKNVIIMSGERALDVCAADLDGDEDLDVLSVHSNYGDNYELSWYENTDGLGTFGIEQTISTHDYQRSLNTSDLDGDGDNDVIAAGGEDLFWYKNTDGLGTFEFNAIEDEQSAILSVFSSDLDGDGDLDVVSASYYDKIFWYENINGTGTFGTQQVISNAADGPTSVYTADLDGDGDMDVLSASQDDNGIAWYENIDSTNSFGTQQIITNKAVLARSVFSIDIDGDGDMDVLSASQGDGKIAWYENTDRLGTFGPQLIISNAANGARDVYAADLDGDGDMDVLSASANNKIAWYRNLTPTLPPIAHFSADSTFGTLPFTVQFLDSSIGTITAWQWDFGDNKMSNYQNPIHTYFTADTFTVSLIVTGPDGSDTKTREKYIITVNPSGVSEIINAIPKEYILFNNYPNPFNPETTIKFNIKDECLVKLNIYDIQGRQLVTVLNGEYQPGSYEVKFNGSFLTSGIYFYRIQAGVYTEVKKMILLE